MNLTNCDWYETAIYSYKLSAWINYCWDWKVQCNIELIYFFKNTNELVFFRISRKYIIGITIALVPWIVDSAISTEICVIKLKFKAKILEVIADWIYHIVMIYHSDSRTGVPRRGDLARQVRCLAIIAEFVQTGLDHQGRPLGATQVSFLSRWILGSLGILTCLWLLLLHLRWRRRALVPV